MIYLFAASWASILKKMTDSLPEQTPAPPRPQYKYWMKIGFSFGVFSFLISPIILFQSVLLFLYLLVLDPTKIDQTVISSGNFDFLVKVSELLFFSILLFIAVNLMIGVLGVLFDKRRIWAIMSVVLTLLSLLLVFIAPRLIAWQSGVLSFF